MPHLKKDDTVIIRCDPKWKGPWNTYANKSGTIIDLNHHYLTNPSYTIRFEDGEILKYWTHSTHGVTLEKQ